MQEISSWLAPMFYVACLIISVIPVRLHKASTTARPFMHTPLTVHAYSITHPSRQTLKLHILTVSTHHYSNLHFQFNHFNHALWVAVRCEVSGAIEATPTVAKASKASKATCRAWMKQSSLNSPVFSRKSSKKVVIGHVPIRKVHLCSYVAMHVSVQLPRTNHLPHSSLSQSYTSHLWLYCLPTGWYLAALKVERPGLIWEANDGCRVWVGSKVHSAASCKRCTCLGFEGIMQLCVLD